MMKRKPRDIHKPLFELLYFSLSYPDAGYLSTSRGDLPRQRTASSVLPFHRPDYLPVIPVPETVKLVEVFKNLPEGAPVTVMLLKTELPLAELLLGIRVDAVFIRLMNDHVRHPLL
ncbi:hypothetical protein [Paenibacillus sp. FSL M7-1046]|uniref:hypothetical protein n=1 Tax=Paenibacillus sp. FSL M7-1046 TaxID=2975315 RepID=UPI0030F7E9B4